VLEIIAIAMLTGRLKSTATSKGRSAWWAALLPLCWIFGQLAGGVVATLAGIDGFALYGVALVGAVIGAGLAALVVNSLSPDPLWDNDGFASPTGAIQAGNNDPNNPYNAPQS
jgi:hypothetical protein